MLNIDNLENKIKNEHQSHHLKLNQSLEDLKDKNCINNNKLIVANELIQHNNLYDQNDYF